MKSTLALGALAGVLVSSSAFAGTLTHLDLAEVMFQTVEIDGVSTDVTGSPRALKRKTVNGVQAIGIAGGAVGGEIDGRETMTFDFESPLVVQDLVIAFLFDDGEFGDHPAEVARINTDLLDGVLSVTGNSTATWTANGTVTNLSIATEAGAGVWRISGEDLFGGAVSYLELTSGNSGDIARYADFSFVSMSAVVPTPGTAALIGMGGLLAARRRRA